MPNQPPTTKADRLASCNDQSLAEAEFVAAYCRFCRQPKCTRAEWSQTKWQQRMREQSRILFEDPQFASPEDPQYADVRAKEFVDVRASEEWTPGPPEKVTKTTLGGVMVGDPPAGKATPKRPPADPWAIPEETAPKVAVGATVRMGKPEEEG